MSFSVELSEPLNGAGRELLTTAATYGKGLLDTLELGRRKDQPLIHQLADAVFTLMEGIDSESPEAVDKVAPIAREVLKDIFSESDLKQHFKNYGWSGMFLSWQTYLKALHDLEGLLANYPRVDRNQLKAVGSRAKKLVEGELHTQQSWKAWAAGKAWECAKPTLVSVGNSLAHQAIEQTGIREGIEAIAEHVGVPEVAEAVVGRSQPARNEVQHPIMDLDRLIGTFERRPHDFLPASRKHQLETALHELDQKSPFFRGVECFVIEAMEGRDLHQALSVFNAAITAFIKQKEVADPTYYQMIYHLASEEKILPEEARAENPMQQAAWARGLIHGLAREIQLEEAVAIDVTYGQKKKILRKAAAQFDQYMQIAGLAQSVKEAHVESLTDLSQAVDLGLRFFKSHPGVHLGQETVQGFTFSLTSWLTLVSEWNASRSASEDKVRLRDTLDSFVQLINKGQFTEALQGLKHELETGPLGEEARKIPERHEEISGVTETVKRLNGAYATEEEIALNWGKAIEHERHELVENLKMWTTFNVVYDVVCQTNPSRSEQGMVVPDSGAVYDHIMKEINGLPMNEQKEKFKTMLYKALDDRTDIGFFTRLIAKLLVPFVFAAVGYFTKHFTKALVEYLTKTMHSPADQPLGTAHLKLVERVNDVLIAHKKAMVRFGADTEGRELGAQTRQNAISSALRASDLNHGYDHNELTKKATELAIDEFLQVSQAHPTLIGWQKDMQDWQSAPFSTFVKGIKFIITLPPQLIIEILHGALKIYEAAKTKFFQWGAKKLLIKLDLVNLVLDTMTDSIYKKSRYTNMIDEVVLQQLRDVEKLLEQEGNGASVEESIQGKVKFKELVDNLFKVVEMRQSLTSEDMVSSDVRRDNFLDAAKRNIQEMADENLKEATVQLLIFAYQAVLTENNMNFLLHKILQKTNSSLRPYNRIQEVFSDEEKLGIARGLGKRFEDLSDQDLRAEFARHQGISAQEVSDTMVDATLREKYAHTEAEIGVVLNRIIEKSVHQVVQTAAKEKFMTTEESILAYIQFLEQSFYPAGTREEAAAQSFISQLEMRLAAIRCASLEERPDLVRNLYQDVTTFMRHLEQNLNAMRAKEKDQVASDTQIRALYQLTGMVLMPSLNLITRHTLELTRSANEENLRAIEEHLPGFMLKLDGMRIQLDTIQSSIAEKQPSWGDCLRRVGGAVVRGAAPPLLDQVEQYVGGRLKVMAEEGQLIYKDPTFVEAGIRHAALLNFVESLGHGRQSASTKA